MVLQACGDIANGRGAYSLTSAWALAAKVVLIL